MEMKSCVGIVCVFQWKKYKSTSKDENAEGIGKSDVTEMDAHEALLCTTWLLFLVVEIPNKVSYMSSEGKALGERC